MQEWYQPHPYGIFPRGNIKDKAEYNKRFGTISKLVEAVNNDDDDGSAVELPFIEIIQNVFSYLDVRCLCVLSGVSTGFYVLVHCTDALKDAYFTLSPKYLDFNGTWRQSAIEAYLKSKQIEYVVAGRDAEPPVKKAKSEANKKTPVVVVPHTPMRVSRTFFCDYLFQSWLCTIIPTDYHLTPVPPATTPATASSGKRDRSDAAFPPDTPQQYTSAFHPVEKVSARDLTYDQFCERFERPNIPVILCDIATEWPMYKLLQGNFKNLANKKKDMTIRGKEDAPLRCEHTNMNLSDYVKYATTTTDERPIYMFDAEFGEVLDLPSLYTVPEYFAHDDFFRVMGKSRPKHRWIIAGPARGGSSFHVDPNYTNAWNANLTGRKRWLLFPPGATPPGVVPSDTMAEVATPVSIGEWFLNNYDASVRQFRREGYECICEAGEIMFVPSGWWHSVVNLEDSVAITHNYVSSSNLANVVKFVKYMKSSISGINEDAENATEEGTKRRQEGFADVFVREMEAQYPDLMRAVEVKLEEEQAERAKRRIGRLPLLQGGEEFTFNF
ncbi:F-box domain/Cupin-like domain/JmjC domain, hydroxylase/Cupin superfamily protein, putative [Angomonas deanei]|uniref:F-box domain/Cupin-like domain/JmjC domain, hydroxylase/Cupin superfamily protein, putative n=1 Tax=Angomonas deanei TaxID=59799 RepID=A0A7G2CFB0_9TRYP|nr:F-box domain/Cupin-like domain/JmjC domain, hydroxylase/Cupin superfamily protein, putative [Angomonas deanei]